MLHALQSTLSSLHTGKNSEFQERLTDIEEARDAELVRLSLWEGYEVKRTEAEYGREVAAANDEYNRMTQLVKERLMARLEAQRKKLREEKAYLDIANDHSMVLTMGYPAAHGPHRGMPGTAGYLSSTSGPSFGLSGMAGGYTSSGGGAAAVKSGGYGSNGDFSGDNSLGSVYGFPAERRSLRRRELINTSAFEEMSGLSTGGGAPSGGERGGYGSGGGLSTASKRRKIASARAPNGGAGAGGNNSGMVSAPGAASGEDFGQSDTLEGILFSRERDLAGTGTGSQGRSSKSYQPPASLKNEDALEDLDELRTAGNAIKRQRVNLM